MNLRLDRLATLHLFSPLQRYRAASRPSIPILMYHSVADDEETGKYAYYRTLTTPSAFSCHMKQLYENGYASVGLSQAVSSLRERLQHPKSVVITFDDGYADFYTHAFPELNHYGFTATIFLPTAYIGSDSRRFKGKQCLTWSQIRELRKLGVAFGSHTVTHPQLCTLKASAVKAEIIDSKKVIENETGEKVESFSYPFAFPEHRPSFLRELRDALASAGYQQGVSTRIGVARRQADYYFLPRLPINSLDDSSFFAAKLLGGYDWLHPVQRIWKLIRSHAA